jgi:hypothetical protein
MRASYYEELKWEMVARRKKVGKRLKVDASCFGVKG